MTASSFADIVQVATATTGTGTVTLGSASSGYRGTSALTNGAQYSYQITDGTARETGQGVYTSAGTTLTRVLQFSTTGSLLNLSGSGVTVTFTVLSVDLTPLKGWTQLAQYVNAGTDATVDFTSIAQTYSDLLLVFVGVSHNNGSATTLNAQWSNDNGSSFTASAGIGASTVNTVTWYGSLQIAGYRLGAGATYGGTSNLASNLTVGSAFNSAPSWRVATGINAIRILAAAGSIDAGTITLYGR